MNTAQAELNQLAAECSQDEWRRLVTYGPFIAAATRSIAEARQVATKFLGRNLALGLVKPSTHDSEL